MFFSNIPNIKYDVKPIQYPHTEREFCVAKNFFRRYIIDKAVFSYTVMMNKYAVEDGQRPDQVADMAYGNPHYDWILLMTNNIINPLFDWPKSNNAVQQYCESSYDDPYAEIVEYRTYKISTGKFLQPDSGSGTPVEILALDEGVTVDETFYNTPFHWFDGTNTYTMPGSEVCRPITRYEYEMEKNESRREIWLLKGNFIPLFIDDFKEWNLYHDSSDYITKTIKKTGV